MNLNENDIKEKSIYKGSFLEIVNIDVKLPDGNKTSRDVVKHPGATAIVAFINEEDIILVEQFRLPLNRVMLEIPAGKLNKNEKTIDCAKRELQEETGYIAGNLEYLGCIATAPGFCDELIYLYKATNLVLGNKHEDDDEFTNVKVMNINKVKEMIKKGDIIDAKTISIFTYL